MKPAVPLAVILALMLTGCAQAPRVAETIATPAPAEPPLQQDEAPPPPALPVPPLVVPLHDDLPPTPVPVGDVLDRIREGSALPTAEHPWVRQERDWFLRNEEYLQRVFGRSQRYLYYIADEVERRGLPMELALLPVVESAFNPFAYSRSHASGLWQFIPDTGRRFGLRQDWWQDQRRDPVLSTGAALDYLTSLHQVFGGDWFLAIAAYNYGTGNVRRAISRNQRQGKPTDFFSLRLPRETRAYVPKLLALTALVKDPARHGISLPAIPDAPYFVEVATEGPMDLRVAARLAGIEVEELHALNAGWNQWVTAPEGPHRLFVPAVVAGQFRQGLAGLSPPERAGMTARAAGEAASLEALARQSGTPVDLLRRINGEDEPLDPDDFVFVPAGETEPLRQGLVRSATQAYQVKSGDSLWSISRRHGMSVSQLAALNGISQRATLRPGQRLWVTGGGRTVAGDKPIVEYRVQKGDTLSSIARRFAVTVANLQAWNGLGRATSIRAGQSLTIYLDRGRSFGG
ncbi:MAG: LysM peptidoglycan-binding domain-containing protein [Steroidobacteraceae bacterium]